MYKKYISKPSVAALLVIIFVVMIRMTWLGVGAYTFPDETRYTASQQLVMALSQGNVGEAVQALTTTDARPFDALLYALPAAAQSFFPHPEGWNHPESLMLVQYFQVLLFAGVAWLFYRISILLFESENKALWALVLYVLVVNNHVYARHILPYDGALLFFMYALLVMLRAHIHNGYLSDRVLSAIGCLLSLAVLAYPGYYWFPVLIMAYIVISKGHPLSMRALIQLKPLLLGGVACLLFFEVLHWWSGKSLVYSLAGLSKGINQGDFHESLEFMVRYMNVTNGWAGVVLSLTFLLTGAVCLVKLLSNRMKVFDPLTVFLSMAFGAWLFHMLLGEVFNFMVFYGRLIHAFVPFMIWSLVYWFFYLRKRYPIIADGLSSVMVVFLSVSFWHFHTDYTALGYSRDLMIRFSSYKGTTLKEDQIMQRFSDFPTTDYKVCNIHDPYANYVFPDRSFSPSWVFFNTGILYPIEGQSVNSCPYSLGQTYVDIPYYLCFEPYGYEGYTPAVRKILREGKYRTRVEALK